jgi:hypothetical protein
VSADRAQERGTAAQPQLDSSDPGDRADEFWAAEPAVLTDAEINRYDLERERAEVEATEDEARPGGPLWNAERGEPYDDATAAMLIAEARYAEYLERESRYYPYFRPDAGADKGRSGIACDAGTADRGPGASHRQDNERGHAGGCASPVAGASSWQARRDGADAEREAGQ